MPGFNLQQGQVRKRRVFVADHSLWRALPASRDRRVCGALPYRKKPSSKVQRPVVSAEHGNAVQGCCAVPRAAGRAVALLPPRGSLKQLISSAQRTQARGATACIASLMTTAIVERAN